MRPSRGTHRELAARSGCTVALKGASTLVADPEGAVGVNPTGNPGMATAGSGDVLTGVVGGLLARGNSAARAARAGVYWHGLAGDWAARHLGEPSLLAGDLVDALGPAWLSVSHRELEAPCSFRAEPAQ